MLNKSLIKARRPYEDRLEIITLCERLKSFYEKYKGTCESMDGEMYSLYTNKVLEIEIWDSSQLEKY